MCVRCMPVYDTSDTLNKQMGEHAQVSHTVVSVLAIEGSRCAMQALSQCASITSGTINILHPLEMVRQIRLISQNPTIATEVEVSIHIGRSNAFVRCMLCRNAHPVDCIGDIHYAFGCGS